MISGLVFVLLGLVLCAAGGAWWWRQRTFLRKAFWVVVVPGPEGMAGGDHRLQPFSSASTAPTGQLRLAPTNPPLHLNSGDKLRVRRDPDSPTLVLPYRPQHTALAQCFAVYGLSCTVAGIAVLLRGEPPTFASDPPIAGLSVAMGAVGVFGVVLLTRTLVGLAGSQVVSGKVVDVNVVPGSKKNTYQPLVQYMMDGSSRRVWGCPRWRKPELDYPASVRISSRPPHEAVGTTPLVALGTLVMLLVGLPGWVLIIHASC